MIHCVVIRDLQFLDACSNGNFEGLWLMLFQIQGCWKTRQYCPFFMEKKVTVTSFAGGDLKW